MIPDPTLAFTLIALDLMLGLWMYGILVAYVL